LVQLVLEGNLLRVGQHGGRHIRLGEKGVDTVQQKSAAGCDDAMRGVALAYRAAFVLFFVILIFLRELKGVFLCYFWLISCFLCCWVFLLANYWKKTIIYELFSICQ